MDDKTIRAAAEKAVEIWNDTHFSPLSDVIELAIRAEVERERKGTYCPACRCTKCQDASYRVSQGGK